jgi:hypothetical protein
MHYQLSSDDQDDKLRAELQKYINSTQQSTKQSSKTSYRTTTSTSDYTISDKNVNELADLIGGIEGVDEDITEKRYSGRNYPSSYPSKYKSKKLEVSAIISFLLIFIAKSYFFISKITPPSIDRDLDVHHRFDSRDLRRSLDLEETPVQERENLFDISPQPPPSAHSYTATTTTTASHSGSDALPSYSRDLDNNDFTVLKYKTMYSFRGKHGKYLTAIPDDLVTNQSSSASSSTNPLLSSHPHLQTTAELSPNAKAYEMNRSPAPSSRTYLLGADGQGIGELMDCFIFAPVDTK